MTRALAVTIALSALLSISSTTNDPEKQKPDDQTKKIQQVLKDLGWDPGPIDGIVGPQTRRAVKAFQRSHKIPATGVVDSRTLTLLSKERPESPPKPPENLRVIEIGEEE